jgi:hypothetical protein
VLSTILLHWRKLRVARESQKITLFVKLGQILSKRMMDEDSMSFQRRNKERKDTAELELLVGARGFEARTLFIIRRNH